MVKAAEALCVTPAALTTRVKLLEVNLGLQLFERFEGRLRLMEAGKEVVAAAAHIDNVMCDLLDTLRGTNELLTGRVRISLVSTAKYFAPRLFAAFMKKQPEIEVSGKIGGTLAVLRAVIRTCKRPAAVVSLKGVFENG